MWLKHIYRKSKQSRLPPTQLSTSARKYRYTGPILTRLGPVKTTLLTFSLTSSGQPRHDGEDEHAQCGRKQKHFGLSKDQNLKKTPKGILIYLMSIPATSQTLFVAKEGAKLSSVGPGCENQSTLDPAPSDHLSNDNSSRCNLRSRG